MKILIVDVYYPAFLKSFYGSKPDLVNINYNRQKKILMNEMFGTADFYSKNLIKIGYPTEDVILNDIFLQEKWFGEHCVYGGSGPFRRLADSVIKKTGFLSGRVPLRRELEIFKKQVGYYKPDIVYSHNLGYLDPAFLFSIKGKIKLLVGQIACPPPPKIFLRPYDLIITSFPHFVGKFKRMGINTEYLPLCFEPSVLNTIPAQKRKYEITFVGGISGAHQRGLQILNTLADAMPIDVWGYGKEELDPKSNLYKFHHGEAWGNDMYKILMQSKITINRHIDVAKDYANNTRLYEATGCGACLITDEKKNLNDLFSEGKEVVAYRNASDLLEKVKYYVNHPKERALIAEKGQKRTLCDHNYLIRMKQLVQVFEKYI
jgi:spore maturation protein CgeB